MATRCPEMTPAELRVMKALWTLGSGSVAEVRAELQRRGNDLAYTTVMTVLQRLAKKNLVVQHRDDRAHRYAPTHGRDELVAGLMVDARREVSAGRERGW